MELQLGNSINEHGDIVDKLGDAIWRIFRSILPTRFFVMAADTKRVIAALDKFVENTAVQLTTEITAELIKTTPVDTGWARSNWVPNIDAPFPNTAGVKTDIDPGPQQDGLARVVSSYQFPRSIFITNNVPYITELNEGWSAQAPAGFVQNAIAKAIKAVV